MACSGCQQISLILFKGRIILLLNCYCFMKNSFSFIHSPVGSDYMILMLTTIECLQRKDVYCLIFSLNIRFWKHLPPNSTHYQVFLILLSCPINITKKLFK